MGGEGEGKGRERKKKEESGKEEKRTYATRNIVPTDRPPTLRNHPRKPRRNRRIKPQPLLYTSE